MYIDDRRTPDDRPPTDLTL